MRAGLAGSLLYLEIIMKSTITPYSLVIMMTMTNPENPTHIEDITVDVIGQKIVQDNEVKSISLSIVGMDLCDAPCFDAETNSYSYDHVPEWIYAAMYDNKEFKEELKREAMGMLQWELKYSSTTFSN